jgi:hypothetical protein
MAVIALLVVLPNHRVWVALLMVAPKGFRSPLTNR